MARVLSCDGCGKETHEDNPTWWRLEQRLQVFGEQSGYDFCSLPCVAAKLAALDEARAELTQWMEGLR